MGHEDDDKKEHGGRTNDETLDESQSDSRDTDLFTSAEYDLRLLSKPPASMNADTATGETAPPEPEEAEAEAEAEADTTSDQPTPQAPDEPAAAVTEETVKEVDELPSSETVESEKQVVHSADTNAHSDKDAAPALDDTKKAPFQRPEPELDELVKQENGQPSGQTRQADVTDPVDRVLPGKDTQSVVVDMSQLNEEAEKAIQEKAAQRAAFSPLESNAGIERITFSNLEALNLPDRTDDLEEMVYDSTIDSHKDELDTAFGTTGEFDELDRPPRRPGRVLFLFIVAILVFLILGVGWAVYNLGEHRELLLKKPINAIEIGWGLQEPPRKIVTAKAPTNQLKTVSGELTVQYVQIDWSKRNQAALVSGEVANGSNVTHGRIELSIELFDEMTQSMIVRRIKCCEKDTLEAVSDKLETKSETKDAESPTADSQPATPSLAPGERKRFATKLDIKKPKRGEVTAKVRVHYSEVMD